MSTQPGAKLKITEAVPANETVAGTSSSSNATITSSVNGVVKVTVGAGANIVWFDNEPVGPPQTGYLEVCKDAGDRVHLGVGSVHVHDHRQRRLHGCRAHPRRPVLGPDQGRRGQRQRGRGSRATTRIVSGIWTIPANALGPNNLTNGTVTVVVPVSGDSTGEVQLHVENSTLTATLKVCKYLTASSAALAGQTFNFDITDAAGYSTTRHIVANTSVNGACKNVDRAATGRRGSGRRHGHHDRGADGLRRCQRRRTGAGEHRSHHGRRPDQHDLVHQPGLRPDRDLQEHRGGHGDPNVQRAFNFSIDGSMKTQPVAAGRCGQPQIVTAGNHTVKEVNIPYGFQFVSSAATGPTGDNRCAAVADCGTRSRSACRGSTTPTNGGETLVVFTNKVQRAQIKICKLIEAGSETPLGDLNYSFTGTVSGTRVAPVSGCEQLHGSAPDGRLPIVDANGTPVTFTITENSTGPYVDRAGAPRSAAAPT